jgi:hypothetical protein
MGQQEGIEEIEGTEQTFRGEKEDILESDKDLIVYREAYKISLVVYPVS